MKANALESELSPRIQHGRAVNAVAEYLRRQLSVPTIFLKPNIASAMSIDVLAVDHAGSGDLHAVEVKLRPDLEEGFPRKRSGKSQTAPTRSSERWDELTAELHEEHLPRRAAEFHAELMSLPAHYRYLAINDDYRDNLIGHFTPLGLYSDDGIGRIGLITLFPVRDRLPEVQVAIAPERFRVDPKKIAAIDKFLQKAKPDMEIRL